MFIAFREKEGREERKEGRRERGREKEGEASISRLLYVPQTRNLGMCPDWGCTRQHSNQLSHSARALPHLFIPLLQLCIVSTELSL